MGTQVDIAGQLHEAGADYVLSLKANQKNAQALADAQASGQLTHHETLELSHGRCEKRQYQMLDSLEGFAKSWKWAGLQAVGKVRREVQRSHEGPPLVAEHDFLCSFKADVRRFAGLVRGYWSVENRCQWVLDVTFGEDHCLVRDQRAAHNLCLLRELVIHVLRQPPAKLSLRRANAAEPCSPRSSAPKSSTLFMRKRCRKREYTCFGGCRAARFFLGF